MNCNTAQNLLSAYIDAELSAGEMNRMRSHLGQCECCHREERELRALKTILVSVPLVEPPLDFEDRLCTAVFSQSRRQARTWTDSWPFVSGVALIAGALTLLIVNRISMGTPSQTKSSGAVARELQRDQTSLAGADPFLVNSSSVLTTSYEGK